MQAEAANLLQAAREEHEAETQDLVSKFSQAQDLAAFVSAEMSRIVEELKAVKDENSRLASEVRQRLILHGPVAKSGNCPRHLCTNSAHVRMTLT